MSNQILARKFRQGITWNAILFLVHKLSYLLLSFFLFAQLDSASFSAWANLNSLVYLFLLWADMGLRKSLPRYLPTFANSKTTFYAFIRFIIIGQTGILLLVALIFIWSMEPISHLLRMPHATKLTHLGIFLFFTEGVLNLLQLIFHAHFWHKQFNLLSTVSIALTTLAHFTALALLPANMLLIRALIIIKISITCLSICASFILLKKLYQTIEGKQQGPITSAKHKEFIIHTTAMWTSISAKSLSERNFMLPLLTYFLGSEVANTYKIANDGALFFQRAIHKTIGTTDTSLLTYAISKGTQSIDHAFAYLIKKTTTICIPLIAILLFTTTHSESTLATNPATFKLFIIITISYLIEAVLSPYERILEVRAHYRLLATAYTPYAIGMALAIGTSLIPMLGLLPTMVFIQSIRLSGALLTIPFARKKYGMNFFAAIRSKKIFDQEIRKQYIDDKVTTEKRTPPFPF